MLCNIVVVDDIDNALLKYILTDKTLACHKLFELFCGIYAEIITDNFLFVSWARFVFMYICARRICFSMRDTTMNFYSYANDRED